MFSTAYESDPITIPQNAEPSPSHVMPDAVARNVISDASRWFSSSKIALYEHGEIVSVSLEDDWGDGM